MLRYQARLEHRTFPINISHQKWSIYIKIYGFSGEYLLKNGILSLNFSIFELNNFILRFFVCYEIRILGIDLVSISA